MPNIERAVLLAAGLGLRMRPLTVDTPKPLLTLGGRTLLDHALDRMAEAGVDTVVVNAHWHAEQIEAHLAARPPPPHTILRRETELLDTGGAVAAALAAGLIGPGAFFVANSDSLWLDGTRPVLQRMQAALDDEAWCAILLHRTFQVHGDVGAGDFFLGRDGVPRRRGEQEIAPYIYAGVTLARPALFAAPPGAAFSMNAVWDRAIAAGRLRAVVHDGLWFHLSVPDDLADANTALMAQFTGATT
jgi:MurNAc alpha-1-phosphate uridylyltransferase